MLTQTKTLWILVSVAAIAIAGPNWISFSSSASSSESDTPSIALVTSGKSQMNHADPLNRPPIPTNLQRVKMMIGYPPIAKNAGIEGKVVLRLLIDEKGNYVRHTVVESFHPMLRIPCEIHAPLIKFKPALRKGKVAKGWVQLPFSFHLTKSGS